jgi:tubulin epsilon
MFSDAFSADHQLLVAAPRAHTYLATCLQARGAIALSDVRRNMARLQPGLRMAHWNHEVGRGPMQAPGGHGEGGMVH